MFEPLFGHKIIIEKVRLVAAAEALVKGQCGGEFMKAEIGRFFDLLTGNAVFQRQRLHVRVGENFQDMDIGEVDPFDAFDKFHRHHGLLFGLGGKAVHSVEIQNHLRIVGRQVVDVFPEPVQLQILAHHLLQAGRRRFQRQSDVHGAGLDHQIHVVAGQNIAPQPGGEVELHLHLMLDQHFIEARAVLDIQIEHIVDNDKPPHPHVIVHFHLVEYMLG